MFCLLTKQKTCFCLLPELIFFLSSISWRSSRDFFLYFLNRCFSKTGHLLLYVAPLSLSFTMWQSHHVFPFFLFMIKTNHSMFLVFVLMLYMQILLGSLSTWSESSCLPLWGLGRDIPTCFLSLCASGGNARGEVHRNWVYLQSRLQELNHMLSPLWLCYSCQDRATLS